LPSKIKLWENGSLLLGITSVAIGLVVSIMAFSRLRDFFFLVVPYLPFTLPGDPLGFILKSLPSIFSVFVSFISSVAGFFFGLKWLFEGLPKILRKKRQITEPGDLANQENILSFLDSTDVSSSSKTLSSDKFFDNNFLSKWFYPGASEFASYVLVSNLKFMTALAILLLLHYFLVSGPIMLKHYMGIQLNFVVPSFTDLWLLFGGLVFTNTVLVISFISLKKKTFKFENRNFLVSGGTAMALFMCVFEELCSLFNPRGAWRSPPRRFICDYVGGAYELATLFESYPVQKNRRVNFLGYLLFPLSVCFLIWGFTTLINFRLDLPDMEYHEFFYRYFLGMVVQIAFPCFLVMAAFHLMSLIQRIFEISRFDSHLIACYCKMDSSSEVSPPHETVSHSNKWRHFSGPENDLIQWIKNPESLREFSVKICWTRTETEAPLIWESRWITLMESDRELQGLIERLLDGLRKVQFEMRAVPNQDP